MDIKAFASVLIFVLLAQSTTAGLMGAGICYSGCAALVVACFSAAGTTFGTVPGALIAATPTLAACNAAFSSCESLCVVAVLAPTA